MRININNGHNMKLLVYSVHSVLGGFDDLTSKTETIICIYVVSIRLCVILL